MAESGSAGCGGACGCGQAAPLATLDRRSFMTYGAAALAAMALAACGVATDVSGPSAPISNSTIKLSDYPALASVGGVATLSISGLPIAVVRESDSTFSAFSRICPHQGAVVSVTSGGFRCPNHGATFNKNGQWTGGQRTSNLRSYVTTYDAAAGTVTIG